MNAMARIEPQVRTALPSDEEEVMEILKWFRRLPRQGDLDRAALDVVCDDLHVGSVWPGEDEYAIAAMEGAIRRAREWVATVQDRRVQRAYSRWLDFFEGRAREARENLTTHEHEKRRERNDAEFNARQQRARDVWRTLPRPTPGQY